MKQKTPPPEPTGKTDDSETLGRIITYGSFGLGIVFGKSANELPVDKRHLINALRLFYAYRHNGYLLFEALDVCTRHKVNPPAWVLEAINEGFQRFNDSPVSLERALHLGKRDREEYSQYREEQPIMREVQENINRDPKRHIAPACKTVANNHKLNRDTVEKQYRRLWHGFYEYVRGEQNP